MANQADIDKYRVNVLLDLSDVASLRTYIKGKTVPAKARTGCKIRKQFRAMSLSDLLAKEGKKIAKNVKPDAESLKWMQEQYEVNIRQREKADEKVRNGAYRKPKSEWKKPGRKAGEHYPSWEKAMTEMWKKRHAKGKDIKRAGRKASKK